MAFPASFTHEEEHRQNVNNRLQTVYLALCLCFILLICSLFYRSACIEGLNPTADKWKKTAVAIADSRTVISGDVYSRDKRPIVKHEYVEQPVLDENGLPKLDEDNNPLTKSVLETTYADGENFTQVIGYSDSRKVSVDEDANAVISERNYRLLDYYSDFMHTPSDINASKGGSLITTLDIDLQNIVYGSLRSEIGSNGKGSCIVLDAKTGEILAMTSLPTYDLNSLDTAIVTMSKEPAEREAYYPVSHKAAKAEGSIFKIVTLTALMDSNMPNFTALDTEFTIDSRQIRDSYPNVGDEINYMTAFARSSNIYFAKAGLAMGSSALTSCAKKYMIGENVVLDFGSVASEWNLDPLNDVELAETSYGQGRVGFSLMTAAMMAQTIANDGVMLKPHLLLGALDSNGKELDSITDENGDVHPIGNVEVLSEVTSGQTADCVTAAMLASTEAHLSYLSQENQDTYTRYNIASKTGTAENGSEENPNNAWLVSFAPANDPQYVVVMNHCETEKYGVELMDTIAGIYRYLFEGNL